MSTSWGAPVSAGIDALGSMGPRKKNAVTGTLGAIGDMGIASGNPWGIGIGLGVKAGVTAYEMFEGRKAEEIEKQRRIRESMGELKRQSAAKLAGFSTQGVRSPMYALGGKVQVDGAALSGSATMINGPSHGAGGVPLTQNGQQIGEAEGGEVLSETSGEAHIASDRVINPLTGNTFAMDIGRLEALKGKREEAYAKNNNVLELNVINKYKREIESLQKSQEQVKQQQAEQQQQMQDATATQDPMMGQQDPMMQGQPQFAYGGYMPKYSGGGGLRRSGEEVDELGRPINNPNVSYDYERPENLSTLNFGRDAENKNPAPIPMSNIQEISKLNPLKTLNSGYGFKAKQIPVFLGKQQGFAGLDGERLGAKADMSIDKISGIPVDLIKTKPMLGKVDVQSAQNAAHVKAGLNNDLQGLGKFNLGDSMKGLLGKGGSNIAPYIDNIGNAAATAVRASKGVPRQGLLNYVDPQLVNYNADRQAANNLTTNTFRAIKGNLADSSQANAMSLGAIGERYKAMNTINQNEQNQNASLRANAAMANNDISRANSDIKLENELREFKYKDSLIGQSAENIADIGMNVQADKKDAALGKAQNAKSVMDLMTANPEALERLLDAGNLDQVEGVSPQILEYLKKNEGEIREGASMNKYQLYRQITKEPLEYAEWLKTQNK